MMHHIVKKLNYIILMLCIIIIFTSCSSGNDQDLSNYLSEIKEHEFEHSIEVDQYDIKDKIKIYLTTIEIKTVQINNQEKDFIVVNLTLSNISESEDLFVYPNQAIIQTSKNKKIEAIISDDMGGKIKPKEFKQGSIVFPLLEENIGGLDKFSFIVEAPKNNLLNKVGEKFVFKISSLYSKLEGY